MSSPVSPPNDSSSWEWSWETPTQLLYKEYLHDLNISKDFLRTQRAMDKGED